MSRSSHSASGQALGYFQQCMRALAELGRRASADPATALRLEVLDDIDFNVGGNPTELLQTKHHLGVSTASMTSVDFWRSINSWMDAPQDGNPVLRLVTTQVADNDLSLLRDGTERDEDAAIEAIENAARTSRSQTSLDWRNRYLRLTATEREQLVRRIVVDDATPHAGGLDSELVAVFRWAIMHGRDSAFLALLKGWWAGISVRLLDRSLNQVTGYDLQLQISDIIDQLRSDSLPVDPDVMQRFDCTITEGYEDRQFVQQLMWIALAHERLWKAIRDYHRSWTQKSFWLRHQLIGEEELTRHAFNLHDEWEEVFDSEVEKMKSDDRNAEAVGRDILSQLASNCRSRLRDRFDQPWFNRGMLQALADGDFGYRIGWHPDFEDRLQEILIDVSD